MTTSGVIVPYSERLAAYDLGPKHPLKPERFTLAVDLMRAYGLLAEEPDARPDTATLVQAEPVETEDLLLVHDRSYVDAVQDASSDPYDFVPRNGIGPGDTPAFHGMHDASRLVCGTTALGVRAVFERDASRGFAVAGGLHHAHRDHAAGFCVYNDLAVAIAMLKRDHPGVRVAYIDIDAHHGDGVEEAFYEDPDVLTISVHLSGRYLFPGTGRIVETGTREGAGAAINVPLPPLADDASYKLVLHEIIAPAIQSFAPDIIVAQCGADGHHADPLTHLGLTLAGYRDLVRGIIEAADEVCDGRICCTGGGGYGTYSVVPRAWTIVLAELLGVEPAEELPESWRRKVEELTGDPAPLGLLQDSYAPIRGVSLEPRAETAVVVDRVRYASPLLADPD